MRRLTPVPDIDDQKASSLEFVRDFVTLNRVDTNLIKVDVENSNCACSMSDLQSTIRIALSCLSTGTALF